MFITMINFHYLFISNQKRRSLKERLFITLHILTYIDTSYEYGKILYIHQ